MDTWKSYGYSNTKYFSGVQQMIESTETKKSRDILIMNPLSGSYMMIKESGDIEHLAGDMLGIKIISKDSKIKMFANSIEAEGDIKFTSRDKDTARTNNPPMLTMSSDTRTISMAAKSISLKSESSGNVHLGDDSTYVEVKNNRVNIAGNSIYLNAHHIYVPDGSEFIRI